MDPPTISQESGGINQEIPSCQGCRRRKLRCSRDQPTCTNCERLAAPCVYETKKNKPGLKPGAIESLNRRVEALEKTVYHDTTRNATDVPVLPSLSQREPATVLSQLFQELHTLINHSGSSSSPPNLPASLQGHQPISLPAASPAVSSISRDGINPGHIQPRKRRRVDSCGNPNIELASQLSEQGNASAKLPGPELLEDIVSAYFSFVQPWIPVLHETRFRSRFYDEEQLPQLTILLHAIVVAAIRYVDTSIHSLSLEEAELFVKTSRSIVVLSGMDGLSVENLQALSIVAFTDMGNGDTSKAWPIIGSLTRTVEYIQLSVETDDRQERPFLKPMQSLGQPESWTQDEERRRVFWGIFNLDRLCSVTTGWNTSLTSDDVQRRLPADGGLWHKEEAVVTPYFGIWDRSAARIGNSITFLPAHYPSPEQSNDTTHPETPTTVTKGPVSVDMSTVGAFAYCIEATESLSRVTTYFLQQRINFQDRQEVGNWLTRFKELDLRLVHWKMFLPQKWKDSNISRRPTHVDMDPNLTLAHITHNTSMILLHQQIAYPSPERTYPVRMPSGHSAETCQVAAVETATITQKYLKYTPKNSPVNSQFAFCAFVSARALLVHWTYYKTDLAPEFWLLVEGLDEMARRWIGPIFKEKVKTCLAGRYSAGLRSLHDKCKVDREFYVDPLGYSTEGFTDHQTNNERPNKDMNSSERQASLRPDYYSRMTQEEPHEKFPAPTGPNYPMQISPGQQGATQSPPDELSAISTMLMDQGFMELDRVIGFDDMMFTAPNAANGTNLPQDGWAFGSGL